MVQIREQDLEELDAMAQAEGISRAAAVREALERYLREHRRQRQVANVMRAYDENPPESFAQSGEYLAKIFPAE